MKFLLALSLVSVLGLAYAEAPKTGEKVESAKDLDGTNKCADNDNNGIRDCEEGKKPGFEARPASQGTQGKAQGKKT